MTLVSEILSYFIPDFPVTKFIIHAAALCFLGFLCFSMHLDRGLGLLSGCHHEDGRKFEGYKLGIPAVVEIDRVQGMACGEIASGGLHPEWENPHAVFDCNREVL